jgi:hypothetical protein
LERWTMANIYFWRFIFLLSIKNGDKIRECAQGIYLEEKS